MSINSFLIILEMYPTDIIKQVLYYILYIIILFIYTYICLFCCLVRMGCLYYRSHSYSHKIMWKFMVTRIHIFTLETRLFILAYSQNCVQLCKYSTIFFHKHKNKRWLSIEQNVFLEHTMYKNINKGRIKQCKILFFSGFVDQKENYPFILY